VRFFAFIENDKVDLHHIFFRV